jgi:glycosyltransferase involved in cell wall biosynthesis
MGRVDVVYVNSLISSELATPFSRHSLVVHVHELSGLAESYGEPARRLVRQATTVLVPSVPAKGWVLDCGVEERDIVVVPGALAASSFEPPSASEVTALRASLGLAADDLVVATIGWVGQLKGSDRFLVVAERVAARLDRAVRFLWIGAGADSGEERRFIAATRRTELAPVVTVLPGREDLRPVYALADVVLVTSREESLSLVALEGAALGRPVVCFPGAGGPDTLAEEGVVTLAPTADPDGVADLVQALLADPQRRVAAGSTARAAATAGHGADDSQQLLVGVLTRAVRGPADR